MPTWRLLTCSEIEGFEDYPKILILMFNRNKGDRLRSLDFVYYLYGSDVYEGTALLWLNPPRVVLLPEFIPGVSRAGSPESQPLPGPTVSPLTVMPPTPVGLVKNT